MLRVVLLLSTLFLLLLAGTATLVSQRMAPLEPGGAEQLSTVDPGDPLTRVASRLERRGLIRDARALTWLARWRGVAGELHVGEYRLSPALSPAHILDMLIEGRVATYAVSIPEGFTAAMIAQRLAEAGLADAEAFLAAVDDPALAAELRVEAPRLEGYLFPETYTLPRGLSAGQLVALMVEQFWQAFRDLAPLAQQRRLSVHEVVTLASIVEKETGAPHERALIASVFANRMARGMRLESDPTTIYGIADFDGNLRRHHLEDAANLHQVRIEGKRLRYAMELLAGCFPESFRERLYPRVEGMQEILGRANDSHVAHGRLRHLRQRLRARMPDLWTRLRPGIDGLIAFHQRRQPQERRQFLAWWKRWQRTGRGALLGPSAP